MERELLLSVVVPVYNAAPYLRQCVESIIHQTYQRLEIILAADGGSTDNSTAICEEYAAKDKRIKVLYRPHEGLVSARKAAISVALGDYVAYVDSDDWLDPDAYEKLFASMGNLLPDVVMHGYQSEYGARTVVCQYTIPVGYYDEAGMENEIYPRLLRAGRTYQWEFDPDNPGGRLRPHLQSDILECVWSKIVRREVLQKGQMLVPDGVAIGEDVVCGVHTLFAARSAMVAYIAPYHYRVRQDSSSHIRIPVDQYRRMFSALYAAVSGRRGAERYLPRLYGMMLRNLLLSGYELFLTDEFSDVLFGNLDGKRVALYGAGQCGREIYQKTRAVFPDRIVLWVDRRFEKCREENLPVEPVEELLRRDYDAVIVALVDESVCEEIREDLTAMGVERAKIRYAAASPATLRAVEKILLEE